MSDTQKGFWFFAVLGLIVNPPVGVLFIVGFLGLVSLLYLCSDPETRKFW